tara:strand:+ start:210 stop:536 length:327 start_codon:yes stop_codon:yes gene_type:complete
MIFVLYFPKGLTGFFIDQSDFITSKSKRGVLYHYLKTIVTALVTIFSAAWLIECLNTILHHPEKEDFVFLWILFSTSNPLSWFAAISLAALGIYVLVANINKIKEKSV